MKVLQCTLSGNPSLGDVIDLHQMAPRGGRCTAGHIVRQVEARITNKDGSTSINGRVENINEIASSIVESSNRPGSFYGVTLRAKDNVITIVDPANESHIFQLEITGKGTVTGVITEVA